jgi:hypothetical protein
MAGHMLARQEEEERRKKERKEQKLTAGILARTCRLVCSFLIL